jgi:hypothetical protein
MEWQAKGCVAIERDKPPSADSVWTARFSSQDGEGRAVPCGSNRWPQTQDLAMNCAPINQSGRMLSRLEAICQPLHGGHADAHASVDAARLGASHGRLAADWDALRPARKKAPSHHSGECCHTWMPFVTDTWCDTRKSFSGKDLHRCRGRFVTDASRIADPVSPCPTRMSRMSHMSWRLRIGIEETDNYMGAERIGEEGR